MTSHWFSNKILFNYIIIYNLLANEAIWKTNTTVRLYTCRYTGRLKYLNNVLFYPLFRRYSNKYSIGLVKKRRLINRTVLYTYTDTVSFTDTRWRRFTNKLRWLLRPRDIISIRHREVFDVPVADLHVDRTSFSLTLRKSWRRHYLTYRRWWWLLSQQWDFGRGH